MKVKMVTIKKLLNLTFIKNTIKYVTKSNTCVNNDPCTNISR